MEGRAEGKMAQSGTSKNASTLTGNELGQEDSWSFSEKPTNGYNRVSQILRQE